MWDCPAAGECSVIGGREFPISDQGGGAIMGLRLIQKTLLAADGLLTITPLAEEVLAHFKHDLDEIVTWSKSARPCDYGQFSPAIFAHANNSDELAVDLLSQTAADIEMWLGGLRKLGANRVCLMGSIGERIVPWLKPLSNNCWSPRPGMQWTEPSSWQRANTIYMPMKRRQHEFPR